MNKKPYIETLDELLKQKNSRHWVKHMIDIPFLPGITISKVEYLEEAHPICCTSGNFYNKSTKENLGKAVYRRIYFIQNNVELDTPILVPEIEWRKDYE